MALHYATAKSRQQALLKWMRQSPRIPQCKRFLKMFLPPSSGSVILSLARLRTLDRAFSSGGERFPDTEEVRSSNLLTPTKCSQLRGYVSGLFCFMSPNPPAVPTAQLAKSRPSTCRSIHRHNQSVRTATSQQNAAMSAPCGILEPLAPAAPRSRHAHRARCPLLI